LRNRTVMEKSASGIGTKGLIRLLILQLVFSCVVYPGIGANQVFAANEIQRLVLSKNTLTLSIGDSYSLTATAIGVNDATNDVTMLAEWNSDAPDIASVYAGTVTAKKEGTAVITATYRDKTAVATVTVHKKVRHLTKDKQRIVMRLDEEEQITLTATYTDGSTEDVTDEAEWLSENEAVAEVVAGKVFGRGSGQTNIVARYGGKTASVPVSVDVVHRLELSEQSLELRAGDEREVGPGGGQDRHFSES